MAEIKSALELALEKAKSYGRATPEEMAASQHQERGRQLAVAYLKEGGDLEAELRQLPPEVQPGARAAVKEVLLRNINLPREGDADERQARALQGLMLAADNPKAMARMLAEVEKLCQNFLQLKNNAFQQLKARFGASVNNVQRALEAQMRQKVRVEAEHLPQFQEEWRRYLASLLEQFEPVLEDLKSRMMTL